MLTIDPGALEAFQALALGFALAGLLATGFELLTQRRASFHLLETGGAQALASVPLIVFSAPFIILRNTVRGRRYEKRHVSAVVLATIIACLWSLICGRVALDLLGAIGS